ncbi:MAG: fused response regulator/phosphatase [Candidatus Poribacteria bacterium]|nr:fused response regulator/phosphatase [Candidatus Poribacteria bacterium]
MAEKILAVDDEVDILQLIEMTLISDGFEVITASNGIEALEKARIHMPDLILLDLMMPEMDGFEVIENLKQAPEMRGIPVVMLTARAQAHERIEGLSAGADDYIVKPFELEELRLRIESILAHTRKTKYINPLIGALGDWFTEDGVEQFAEHLRTASAIQQHLLPQLEPKLAGFDISGLLESSMSISGDFYDFIPLEDNRLGIVIADVRGKGIPAALLMVMIRTSLRLVCREDISPSSVLKRVNDLLVIDTAPDFFATIVYGILDPKSMTFTYSNAGHCYPMLLRGDKIEELQTGGMILGCFGFAEFETETIELESGNKILFYTDGLTEAEFEAAGEFYGEERLEQVFKKNSNLPADELCKKIREDLFGFCGTNQQKDDITIVAIKASTSRD